MNKVYEIITQKFIEKLEEGVVPWKKEWDAPSGRPMNLISKKPYHGVNTLLLGMMPYDSPYWLTYKQAANIGAHVKKGEKSTMVTFYKNGYAESEGEEKFFPILRYYNVFNTRQIEGIPSKYFPTEKEVAVSEVTGEIDERCRPILLSYKERPEIRTGGDRAFYSPGPDYVQVPKRKYFSSLETYWATLFHELVHSTMHEDRLNRKSSAGGFAENYSFEELVAEIGAAFLCANSRISNLEENQSAYIRSWLTKLKSEPTWIVLAAQKANKAVKYITGELEEDYEVEQRAS